MNGKEKCKALKQIRKQIAENNDINYVVEECKHKGNCKGTCPKCEAEVRYLERELEKKRSLGQKVAVAGVSLGIAASFSACSPMDVVYSVTYPVRDAFGIEFNNTPTTLQGEAEPELEGEPIEIELEGDVEYIPENDPKQYTDGQDGYDVNGDIENDGKNCGNSGEEGIPELHIYETDGEAVPEELIPEIEGSIEYIPDGSETM